jgi:nucleotide-binding universal stress UspA family protein
LVASNNPNVLLGFAIIINGQRRGAGIMNEQSAHPFQRILCPTDFSESSLTALEMARDLALVYGADLILFHSVDHVPVLPPPQIGAAAAMADNQLSQTRKFQSAQKSLEKMAKENSTPDITIIPETTRGRPEYEVIKYANENAVDLIVVSASDMSGWLSLFFRSAAERIIRSAPCHVLAVQAE